MSKHYYRFIVMYTLNEEDGIAFINNIKSYKGIRYKKLTDQSSFTISGDSIPFVKQLLKQAIPNTENDGRFFVKLYYSAALTDITQQDKRDYIVEEQIF